MAYAFEPINLDAMKALKPFAAMADGYTSDVTDATVVRLTITVGELRFARRVWNIGANYKYDDRNKLIESIAAQINTLGNEEISSAVLALKPIYVQTV